VLDLLADGRTNAAIAIQLQLSVNTVRNYVQAVLTKLGAHSKLEAVATALREGIVKHPELR
jgi:two-component system nitrate/nitrite response regulator NarL